MLGDPSLPLTYANILSRLYAAPPGMSRTSAGMKAFGTLVGQWLPLQSANTGFQGL